MKKFFTLLIVLTAIVSVACAQNTKVRFVVRDEVGMGEQGRKLYIYIWGDGYIHTAWPGIECDYLGNDGTKYWYEKFVEIPNDKLNNIQWKFTNNESSWENGKETVSSGSKDLSANEYCSWIYSGGSGNNQNLSTNTITYYLWKTTDATNVLSSMTKDGQSVKANIDASSIASANNYLIIPSYSLNGGSINLLDIVYRPVTDSGNKIIDNFVNYSGNAEVTGGDKNWEFHQVSESTFELSLNLETKAYTLNPSFTRNLGSVGYATFSSPYAVAIPDGVKAYFASAPADGRISMTKLSNGIPANTGAFLQGTGEVTFTPAASTDDASSNQLKPGTAASVAPVAASYYYVFARQGEDLGFYPTNSTVLTNSNLTGKAYLATSVSASRLSFSFDDETTGIGQIESDVQPAIENAVVYNLNGQRVVNPTKGLYIVNGKKVIIK